MLYVIIGLIVVVCVLLVLVVLAQNSKGGGLSSSFGGSSASSMIGVKRTNDLLENLTWGFAGALMVLCVSSAFMVPTVEAEDTFTSPNIDAARSSGLGLPSTTLPDPNTATGNEDGEVLPQDGNPEGAETIESVPEEIIEQDEE